MRKTNRVGTTLRPGAMVLRAIKILVLTSLFAIAAGATPLVSAQAQQGKSDTSQTAVTESFAVAARHWGVPVQVLMAVGYVESHWEQRDGEPSLDHGYGIMHLVDAPGSTLSRAAQLSGLSEEAIRKVASANIEAGAALLSDISRKLNATTTPVQSLAAWYPAIEEYSGADDASVKEDYAQEVLKVMSQGARD